MDKKLDAARLLRAMGDVDDKYIEEALEVSAPAKRAAITTLRRYSGLIGAVAAALLLVAAGGVLFKTLGSAQSASEAVPAHNAVVDSENAELNMYSYNAISGDQATDGEVLSGGMDPAAPAEAVEGEEGDLLTRDASTYDSLSFAYQSLDDLEEAAGYDFNAPETVEGSTSCMYINSVNEDSDNIAEIQYIDEDDNIICTIRKAPGSRNISGCIDCYSIEERVETEDGRTVTLSGSQRGYAQAVWTDGGYSYAIVTEDLISEQAMLGLISQVS